MSVAFISLSLSLCVCLFVLTRRFVCKRSGSFSRVRLAQHIKTGKKFAVKIISKTDGPAATDKGKEMIGETHARAFEPTPLFFSSFFFFVV